MKKRLIYLWLILTQLKPALAYIDPGTGPMIITSAWSVILAILAIIGAFFVKIFFKPIKKTVLTIWRKIKKRNITREKY